MKPKVASCLLPIILVQSLLLILTPTSYFSTVSADSNTSSVAQQTYNVTSAGVTSRFYRNPSSDRLVIILHGGAAFDDFIFTYARDAIGWYELAYYLVARGMNVAVPYSFNYSANREPWPIQLALSFKALNITRFYLLGHSAGGTIAANVLVSSNLFQKVVIMNAPLWWNVKSSKLFAVAAEASKASADHMLVYGSNDRIVPVKPNAETWMSKANPLKAKLKVFEYGHDLDAKVKETVYTEIASFLGAKDNRPPAYASPPVSSINLTLRATDQNGKDTVTFKRMDTVNLWINVKGDATNSSATAIILQLTDSAGTRFMNLTYPVNLQGSIDFTLGFAFNIPSNVASGKATVHLVFVGRPNHEIATATLRLTIS